MSSLYLKLHREVIHKIWHHTLVTVNCATLMDFRKELFMWITL